MNYGGKFSLLVQDTLVLGSQCVKWTAKWPYKLCDLCTVLVKLVIVLYVKTAEEIYGEALDMTFLIKTKIGSGHRVLN